MASTYHMVHYRRFDVGEENLQGATLESLCRAALIVDPSGVTLWERARDRLFAQADEEGRQILLNKVADLSSAVFGEMCLVQSDGLQALLELKPSTVQLSNITTAEVFNLGERGAPTGSQFVRGLAYWLAIGNHVFFVKTQSMTSEYIRAYLDWLLKIRTTSMKKDISFILRAEFDKSQVGGDIGEIRSLRLSGKSAPQFAISPPDPNQSSPRPREGLIKTTRKFADKSVQFAQALPVVEALFGKEKAESLVKSLGQDEYLSVDASVKIGGRRTAETRAKLRDIANDLAEMTDGKIQVEGKDGKISDGDAVLRTRMPFDLPHEGSNLLEFDNVADQLQEVYNRFVSDGKITS